MLPPQRIFHPPERQALLLNRVNQRLQGRRLRVVAAAADEDPVAAGLNGQDSRSRDLVVVRDGLHLEVVAQDDAVEPELLAKQSSDDVSRQRGGPAFVQGWKEHVRRHDHGHLRPDGRVERHELDLAQPRERVLDERELEMRVGARVAVTRKVFPASGDTFGLQSANDCDAQRGHVGGLLRQRTVADDRVLRIRMDIEHGGIVERDANRRELQSQRTGKPPGQRRIAASAERRHRRPLGEGSFEARDAPAFLIDAHPERQIGHEPRRFEGHLGELLRLCDISREKNDAAETRVACDRLELRGDLLAVEAGNQQLTDLPAERGGRHGVRILTLYARVPLSHDG